MKVNYFSAVPMAVFFLMMWAHLAVGQSNLSVDRMKGVCMVAPPAPFKAEPLQEVRALGANWVAVVPFGYTILNETQVHYNSNRQWWGERTIGAVESIKRAKAAGLKVFLKPHVYVPGSWPGGIEYDTEAKWQKWESDYRSFITHWVDIAAEYEVDGLAIGTEFKVSSIERPDFWKNLISNIRCDYNGLLSYCANWDEYHQITFWDQLDFIGVDAYFPLSNLKTPEVNELIGQWSQHSTLLEQISNKFNRPIIFTEYGYLSVDQCAYNTWELETKVRSLPINEQAQANAIQALWKHFNDKSWWRGGLYWKWFPEMKGHEGYIDRDYTFQNKLAEEVIKEAFSTVE